jgi:hypothetical protein
MLTPDELKPATETTPRHDDSHKPGPQDPGHTSVSTIPGAVYLVWSIWQ